MKIPYTSPLKQSYYADPPPNKQKLASHIRPYDGSPVEVGLLGVPDDIGVTQGKGRAGAALGPSAIRQQLLRYGTLYNVEREADLSRLSIADFGDLIPDKDSVEKTHQRLSDAVDAIIKIGALPIVFGGGHDLTFGSINGLAKNVKGSIGGLTIDAHFDVRETINGVITSGTPFRNILDRIDAVQGQYFVEIGANALVNSKNHLDYLNEKGAKIFHLSELRKKGIEAIVEKGLRIAGHETDKIFCSIDLDGIAQAFAPGVSAPSPEGLTAQEVILAAYLFGLDSKVSYFDIMELNPNFDQDGRTARLAVAILLHFLAGLVKRKQDRDKKIGFRKI